MILKTKTLQNTTSPQAIAGQKQEQNVAFFLRRAFKDHPEILVINDFKFSFNDEVAQIDHLIIYPYGFVLIESKSIKGHVKVNQQGEWNRSFNQKWSGMPSPIKQVELQQKLLKQLLKQHKAEVLGKLLGIKQQGFNGRKWDNLCVVSSDTLIDRKSMPKAVSEQLVKTEFLVDKLESVMNIRNKIMRVVNINDTRPAFNQQELYSIGNFILSQHIDSINQINSCKQTTSNPTAELVTPIAKPQVTNVYQEAQPIPQVKLSCKHCGESTNYIPMYGKFGYYINCNQCTKNTPMKQACPMCHSKNTKVQKRKETYSLNCQDCSYSQQIV
ncbi:NERD domain-containing protein [Shewanella sp. 10N.7]|uniref:nuclease-related domain-containing protein n=1 Tax=Shewanella sp. 10N.7 TaxID=2885093 RepID=UPI001E48D2EE|nr:nuclease-related domain-containing protein [Shewanella sp. 10N.7]MCC4833721.1 NERD domain-containing protein [Shewanella sp. 10N.7]